MKLEELYAKDDGILAGMNVSPVDHFIFDLEDDNSQNSLKSAFPGMESVLKPECGKYLVATPIVENPDVIVLLFPEESDGNAGLYAFNSNTHQNARLDAPDTKRFTLGNLSEDFANMEGITKRFNQFVWSDGKSSIPDEVKDIGSIDITHEEPVEIPTTTTNEDNEMKFKPIQEDTELDRETKWVEIPNTNAGGVTVTEEGEGEDPFAGEPGVDPNAGDAGAGDAGGEAAPTDAAPVEDTPPADGGDAGAGDAAPVDGGGEAAPADAPTTEAPAIDDPKAKMRELLAYYTNYMSELVQDPNTSTELIAATQEMIDSLISNMESADSIEEVKADAEEAAKEEGAAEEAPAEEVPPEEPPPADEPPVDTPAEDAPVAEATDEDTPPVVDNPEQAAMDAKIDAEVDDLHKDDLEDIAPATSDDVLTPGDLHNSPVNDVDLTGFGPTPEEELAATAPDMTTPAPTSDVLDDTELPTPDEEVELLGADDYTFGADGLPVDTFDGDIDALGAVPAAKKVSWSSDYATNGVATSDDNNVVVPEVLKELSDYYKKVSDEVSKVPGKEDVAMKLQKIQILSQTIQNEWNAVLGQIGDACANSYDRSNMGDLEKDELDTMDAFNQVGADVMADDEREEEDDLAIADQINTFCESWEHLM